MQNTQNIDILLNERFNVSLLANNERFGLAVAQNKTEEYITRVIKHVVNSNIKIILSNYNSFTRTASYMNRLVSSPNTNHLMGDLDRTKHMGNIRFTEEFLVNLRNFNFPERRGNLKGLPFICTYTVGESIRKLFQQQGAEFLGVDYTGSDREPVYKYGNLRKNCLYFVAEHFVAFAVIEDIALVMSLYAEVLKVCFVTYKAGYIVQPIVTVVARSVTDLKTICAGVSRDVDESVTLASQKTATTVVISMGYKGRMIDRYLLALGNKMRTFGYKIVYYVGDTRYDAESLPLPLSSERRYKFATSGKCDKAFKINNVSNWTFVLTQVGHAENVYDRQRGDYQMMIPVPQFDDEVYPEKYRCHSILINRHLSANMNIYQFGRDVESNHNDVVASGFFTNPENREPF